MTPAPARLRDLTGFRATWIAVTASGFGTYVTSLAVSVLVVQTLHGGSAEVGLVRAAGWVPYLLFGLIVGVLVDRMRRQPLLVVTDLGRSVLLVGIPVLAWSGHLGVGLLVAITALVGLLSLVHDAAYQAFIPRLVPLVLLTPAHARFDQSDAVAQASGPALAGALTALVGAAGAVLVDAASYLFSGLLLTRVRLAEPPSQPWSLRGVGTQAREGLRWVYGNPALRPMAIGSHGWFLGSALVGAVLTPFALNTLGLGPLGLGIALSFAGVGALLGSLISVRLGRQFGAGRVIIAGHLLCGAAWALLALSTPSAAGWSVFGAGQLVLGFAMGTQSANEMGYRQVITPDRLQGRMNATIRSINRAMIVIGSPIAGLLGDAHGYRSMLWTAAGLMVLVCVGQALSSVPSARIDDHLDLHPDLPD